jgi:hypothetical protein
MFLTMDKLGCRNIVFRPEGLICLISLHSCILLSFAVCCSILRSFLRQGFSYFKLGPQQSD